MKDRESLGDERDAGNQEDQQETLEKANPNPCQVCELIKNNCTTDLRQPSLLDKKKAANAFLRGKRAEGVCPKHPDKCNTCGDPMIYTTGRLVASFGNNGGTPLPKRCGMCLVTKQLGDAKISGMGTAKATRTKVATKTRKIWKAKRAPMLRTVAPSRWDSILPRRLRKHPTCDRVRQSSSLQNRSRDTKEE